MPRRRLDELPFARKYDIWTDWCWSELILPNIDQNDVFQGFAKYIDWPTPDVERTTPGRMGQSAPIRRRCNLAAHPFPTFRLPEDITQPRWDELYAGSPYCYYKGSYRGLHWQRRHVRRGVGFHQRPMGRRGHSASPTVRVSTSRRTDWARLQPKSLMVARRH